MYKCNEPTPTTPPTCELIALATSSLLLRLSSPEIQLFITRRLTLLATLVNHSTRRNRSTRIVVLCGLLSFTSLALYLEICNQLQPSFSTFNVLCLCFLLTTISRNATQQIVYQPAPPY